MKRFLLTSLAFLSAAAIAAPQPSGGTLSEASGPLSFVGGPFYAPNLASDGLYLGSSEPQPLLVCKKQAMNCDRFALGVNLTEASRQDAAVQKQVLSFSLEVQEQPPLPVVKPEFHLYLLDASGKQLARSEPGMQSSPSYHFSLPLQSVPNGRYTVIVTGYNGLGASYSVEIGLVPATE